MSVGATGTGIGRLLGLLVQAGIVDGDAVMAGRVTATDLSRSNDVGAICVDGRPVAVVKGGSVSADGVDPVLAENAALAWLAGRADTARLAPAVLDGAGAGVAAGAAGAAVVTEFVDGVALHQALAGGGARAAKWVAELGRVLGTLHAAPGCRALAVRRPWILDVPEGRWPSVFAPNAAMVEMFAEIARRPALAATIGAFAEAWSPSCVVHGDVKFDNVIVAGGKRVVLVDWELAGRGDPAWDLAGVADGLLVPVVLGGATLPAFGPGLAATLLGDALAAYGRVAVERRGDAHLRRAAVPRDAHLNCAIVARLAQTATQLAAMGADDADAAEAAPRMLDAASAYAAALDLRVAA